MSEARYKLKIKKTEFSMSKSDAIVAVSVIGSLSSTIGLIIALLSLRKQQEQINLSKESQS